MTFLKNKQKKKNLNLVMSDLKIITITWENILVDFFRTYLFHIFISQLY